MGQSLNGATKVNAMFYKGKSRRAKRVTKDAALAVNAGQLGYYDSDGEVREFASNGAKVNVIFAEDETAAAGTTHVFEIDSESILQFSVVDGTDDAAATRAMVNSLYAIRIISNVACVDLDTGTSYSNDIFKVDGLLADDEPERHAIADVPGHVYGHFIQTASWDVDAG